MLIWIGLGFAVAKVISSVQRHEKNEDFFLLQHVFQQLTGNFALLYPQPRNNGNLEHYIMIVYIEKRWQSTHLLFKLPPESDTCHCSSYFASQLVMWPYLTSHGSVQFSSVAQLCPTLCNPMNRSRLGLPVHHQLLESTQTHAHRVEDAIQPSHPLSSPSPPALNPSQHQGLFQWVNSSNEVQNYHAEETARPLGNNPNDYHILSKCRS